MAPGVVGHLASPGGALNEALLNQVGLNDVFNGAPLLSQSGRQRFDTDRPAAKLVDNRVQQQKS